MYYPYKTTGPKLSKIFVVYSDYILIILAESIKHFRSNITNMPKIFGVKITKDLTQLNEDNYDEMN